MDDSKFLKALIGALEAVPKILEAKIEGNALMKEHNALTQQIIAGRAELREVLSEVEGDVAPKETAKPGKTKPAPAPEPDDSDDDDAEEEETPAAPAVTQKEIQQFYKDETKRLRADTAVGEANAVQIIKRAFAAVRKKHLGVNDDGKPKELGAISGNAAVAFLEDFKKKVPEITVKVLAGK